MTSDNDYISWWFCVWRTVPSHAEAWALSAHFWRKARTVRLFDYAAFPTPWWLHNELKG